MSLDESTERQRINVVSSQRISFHHVKKMHEKLNIVDRNFIFEICKSIENITNIYCYFIVGGFSTLVTMKYAGLVASNIRVNDSKYWNDIDICVSKNNFDKLKLNKNIKIVNDFIIEFNINVNNNTYKVQIINLHDKTIEQKVNTFDLNIVHNFMKIEPYELELFYDVNMIEENIIMLKNISMPEDINKTISRLIKYNTRYPLDVLINNSIVSLLFNSIIEKSPQEETIEAVKTETTDKSTIEKIIKIDKSIKKRFSKIDFSD